MDKYNKSTSNNNRSLKIFHSVWKTDTLTSHKTETVGDRGLPPCSLLVIKYTLPTPYPLVRAVHLLNPTAPADRSGLPQLHGHKPTDIYLIEKAAGNRFTHARTWWKWQILCPLPCQWNTTAELSRFSQRLHRLFSHLIIKSKKWKD